MEKKLRIIIATVVIITAAFIIINPFSTKIKLNQKFEVTKQPVQALQESINNGKPVFLEFYASW